MCIRDRKYTEALEKKNAAQEKFDKLEKEKGLGSGNKELAKAAEDLMKYEKSLQTTEKALDKSEKNLNAANKELTTYSDKSVSYIHLDVYKRQVLRKKQYAAAYPYLATTGLLYRGCF